MFKADERMKAHFIELLNYLCEYGLDEVLCKSTYDAFENWACNFCDSGDYNLTFAAGETKAVVIDQDFGWVLKLPFKKGYRTENLPNHCDFELENYRKACEAGVDEFFAATDKLFNYYCNGYFFPCYVMELVDADEDRVTSEAYDRIRSSDCDAQGLDDDEFYDYCDDYESSDLAELCIEENYGEKEARKLFAFLRHNNINDVHTGNIGYIDGAVVLIDYSGYYPNGKWWEVNK